MTMHEAKRGTPAAAVPVLSVQDLTIELGLARGSYPLVSELSFDVMPGEILCIVGESGSGKTLTALSLMSLLVAPVRVSRGRIELNGEDMLMMSEARREEIRGDRIAMVFQDPMSSLNPVLKIGVQITESIARHQPSLSRNERMERAEQLLAMVGVPSPRERLEVYPHEMSGGMRQRVLIAMALANNPQVIVADEPTTALDVTVQAQVMDVMRSACKQAGAALLLITHDMGLVAESADRVIVMYAGRIVEQGPVDRLFRHPRHAYTSALLSSIPNPHTPPDRELQSIEGEPPNLSKEIHGCAFFPRCWLARGRQQCATIRPEIRDLGGGQYSACHFAEEVAGARQLESGGVR